MGSSCSKPNTVQDISLNFPPPPPKPKPRQWEWEVNSAVFSRYCEADCALFDAAQPTGGVVTLTLKGQSYVIDTDKMIQTNTVTGNVRRIRIAAPPSTTTTTITPGGTSGTPTNQSVFFPNEQIEINLTTGMVRQVRQSNENAVVHALLRSAEVQHLIHCEKIEKQPLLVDLVNRLHTIRTELEEKLRASERLVVILENELHVLSTKIIDGLMPLLSVVCVDDAFTLSSIILDSQKLMVTPLPTIRRDEHLRNFFCLLFDGLGDAHELRKRVDSWLSLFDANQQEAIFTFLRVDALPSDTSIGAQTLHNVRTALRAVFNWRSTLRHFKIQVDFRHEISRIENYLQNYLRRPLYWALQENQRFQTLTIPLPESDFIYSHLRAMINTGPIGQGGYDQTPTSEPYNHLEIISVTRVENASKWGYYAQKRCELYSKLVLSEIPPEIPRVEGVPMPPDYRSDLIPEINEVYLWHGTSHEAQKIHHKLWVQRTFIQPRGHVGGWNILCRTTWKV
eukprot:PhF_6_TR5616/c1_g1_i1/m.8138